MRAKPNTGPAHEVFNERRLALGLPQVELAFHAPWRITSAELRVVRHIVL